LKGRDAKTGKRIICFKGGYEKKTDASNAMRDAIMEHEKTHGKITRRRGVLGTLTFGFELGDETKANFTDQATAAAALAAAIERRAAAEQVPAEVDPTFQDYIHYWLDEHAIRRIAPKTLERYREFGEYLIRHIGDTKINDISTAQIQRMIHTLSDHGGMITKEYPAGRPLAPKTVRHLGTLLYTALAEADRLGILKIRHPMANKRVRLPKLVKRDPPVIEKSKLKALFDRARTTRLYPFIVLAAGTGCRRGELLAVQWADVNENTSEITISKSLEQTKAGGLRVKSTKSEKPRKFVVPEAALEVLAEHRLQQDEDKRMFGSDYQDHGLIFCQPHGAYYSPDREGARVKELMVAVGLKGVSLHSLRHTFATELLSDGVPLAVVSERLGHADQNITLSIYSHAIPADSRAAAKVWNDSMADVLEGSKKAGEERSTAKYCTEGTEKRLFVAKKTG
jgi:integrase